MNEYFSFLNSGMKVWEVNYLPIKKSYPACDVETKQEIKISSDDTIDAFELNGELYASPKVCEYLSSLPTITNIKSISYET